MDRLTGDVTSLRSMLQDYVQQREASEEVLRRGEERYRVLVDNLTTIVFQVDRDLRWTFLNPAWETVTGRSPAESVGQIATVTMVDEDATACGTMLRAVLDGQRSLAEQVVRVRCVAGNVHWLELRAIPMLDRRPRCGVTAMDRQVYRDVENPCPFGIVHAEEENVTPGTV